MNVRYWAPTQPRLGPGPTDLAMIEPTGDARLDLGAALLGMHRVGAAACKVAAATPLLTESTLIKSLAAAREALADPMINSVSKSTSGATYAGLLIRDLFDDAERGSVDLWRHCVAKGVAPAVAAERVGAVYGVPAPELGNFRRLAADPRVNPAALADTADRVLLSYVEKVVSEEVAEPVSKATATQVRERPASLRIADLGSGPVGVVDPDDPSTPYYDARDARGRFARREGAGTRPIVATESGGAGARAITAVAPTAAEPAPVPAISPLMATLRRRLGLGRQQAPEAVGVTPDQVAAQEVEQRRREEQEYQEFQQFSSHRTRQRGGTRSPAAPPAQAVRLEAQQVEITPALAARLKAASTPPGPPKRNLLAFTPDTEHYDEEYGNVVSFAMPQEQFANFFRDQAASPAQMFRAKYLIDDHGGEGLVSHPSEEVGGEDMDSALAAMTVVYDTKSHPPHTAVHIGYDEMVTAIDDGFAAGMRRQDSIAQLENEALDYVELAREDVQKIPDRGGDGYWLVQKEGSEEVPLVQEVRLLNPRVAHFGPASQSEMRIDKNQAWRPATAEEVKRLVNEADKGLSGMPTAELYWQEEPETGRQAMHQVFFMVPAEEHEVQAAEVAARNRPNLGRNGGVDKAVAVADRTRRVRTEPRDARGRWTTGGGVSTAGLLERVRPVAVPTTEVPETEERRVREEREAREYQEFQQLTRTRQAKKPVAVPRRALRAEPIQATESDLSKLGAERLAATRLRATEDPPDLPKLNSLDLSQGWYQSKTFDVFQNFLRSLPGDHRPGYHAPIYLTGRQTSSLFEHGVYSGDEAQLELAATYLQQQINDDRGRREKAISWSEGELPEDWPEYEMRSMLQNPEVGYLQDPNTDPDRSEREVFMNVHAPRPVVLIDFSDDDVRPHAPSVLEYVGTEDHYHYLKKEDNQLSADIPGDIRMNFPVIRYRVVPASPSDEAER